MKSRPTVVQVTINEQEALAIINALQRGISTAENSEDDQGATSLLGLLRGNFQSSVAGIHDPR